MAINTRARWRLEVVIPGTTNHQSLTVYLDTDTDRLVYVPTSLVAQLAREALS